MPRTKKRVKATDIGGPKMQDNLTVEKLQEMGIWPEGEELTSELKKNMLASILGEGDLDLANAVSKLSCGTSGNDYIGRSEIDPPQEPVAFAAGQAWVSPDGVAYHLIARSGSTWKIEINNNVGLVTASTDPWLFGERKFRNLVKASKLKLYDPTPKIDRIAERLEVKGHKALASALDAISSEYIEARQPSKLTNDRINRANDQIEVLRQQIYNSDNLENKERLLQDLENAYDELRDEEGSAPPNDVSPEGITTEPNSVTP